MSRELSETGEGRVQNVQAKETSGQSLGGGRTQIIAYMPASGS